MKRHGFTILELLAVFIIIAVMVAILFPVFQKAHECARCGVSCMSDEKQIGLGIIQYVQDNDENMPNIAAATDANDTWRVVLWPYIKTKVVFQCPYRKDTDKGIGPDGYPRSYAANSAGITYSGKKFDKGNGAFAGPGSKPVSIAEIDHPNFLIMLCEVSRSNQPDFNIDNLAAFNPQNRILWAGHEGMSLYLFADGHVKGLRPLDTKVLWHRNASTPLTTDAIAILQAAQDRAGK